MSANNTSAIAGALIPSRYHYMINLLLTLKAFGGELTSKFVYEWFQDQGIARSADLADVQRSKESRFVKEVRFARLVLFYSGMLAEDLPGHWRLTPLGWECELDVESARALARATNRNRRHPKTGKGRSEKVFVERPTTGPRPQSWSRMVARDISGTASTYIMEFGNSGIWKVGFAANITARLAELNRHVPWELLSLRWELRREHQWSSVEAAYNMEQRVLEALLDKRTTGERLRCPESLLVAAWEAAKAE